MGIKPFLKAEWRDLVMANYVVDPSVLTPFIPAQTELDFYNDLCYVSLVGFMFNNVRVRGLRIPLHTDFPEINLRFYVRYKEDGEWRRGVVFLKEIVPKRAITLIANSFFGEHYVTMPAMHTRKLEDDQLVVSCVWKSAVWNELKVTAGKTAQPLRENSEEEFITQHFWGYTAMPRKKTGEYHVSHPAWNMYPVTSYHIQCDFANVYGTAFRFLSHEEPASVFLAEGSPVTVYSKRVIG